MINKFAVYYVSTQQFFFLKENVSNLFPLFFRLLDIYNFVCTMIASSTLQSSSIYKNAGIEQIPDKYKFGDINQGVKLFKGGHYWLEKGFDRGHYSRGTLFKGGH